jgi:hypothetical protein
VRSPRLYLENAAGESETNIAMAKAAPIGWNGTTGTD